MKNFKLILPVFLSITFAFPDCYFQTDAYTVLYDIKIFLDSQKEINGAFPTDIYYIYKNLFDPQSISEIEEKGYQIVISELSPDNYRILTKNEKSLPNYQIIPDFEVPTRIFADDIERANVLKESLEILNSCDSREWDSQSAARSLQDFSCQEVCAELVNVIGNNKDSGTGFIALDVFRLVYDQKDPNQLNKIIELLENEDSEPNLIKFFELMEKFPDKNGLPLLEKLKSQFYDPEDDEFNESLENLISKIRSQK